MKYSSFLPIVVILAAISAAYGQDAGACSENESRQFDFWIGEWSIKQRILKADGTWFEAEARTSVAPALDGCVLVENWNGDVLFFWEGMKKAETIKGFSVRSYDRHSQKWVINWMDTRNPRFNAFEGNFKDGKGEFFRTISADDGTETIARIVFSEIARSSVHWELAISSDEGKKWRTLWIMEMTRKTSISEGS
jgi:hypothetical protein